MTAPTPEQRAEWRADAEMFAGGQSERDARILDLLDALDAAESATDILRSLHETAAEQLQRTQDELDAAEQSMAETATRLAAAEAERDRYERAWRGQCARAEKAEADLRAFLDAAKGSVR